MLPTSSPPPVFTAQKGWILALVSHLPSADAYLVCPKTADLALYEKGISCGIKGRLLEARHDLDLAAMTRSLCALIRNEKIQVLHTHGYKSDIIGFLAARRCGIPIISTPHGWCADGHDPKLWAYETLDRRLLHHFDYVAPLSQELCTDFGRMDSRRWGLIENFVDLDDLPAPESGDAHLVTYIGRLAGLKRCQDLILAMADLPDHRLQLIGDGPCRPELEALAKRLGLGNRITFMGYREDRLHLLNNGRFLVLPSLSEGISRVVMEAMALGRTVIGTDIPGITQLIEDQKTGFVVPVRDPKAIAGAILAAGRDPVRTEKIQAAARHRIHTRFSAAVAARRYAAVYERLCRK